MKCKLLVCMIICCILLSPAFSQTKTVSGTVSDEKGAPLQGATISVKNAKKGSVITSANGTYLITVPANATELTVSYVGMRPIVVSIEGKAVVDINLKNADSKLSEVVVVGYGTKSRAEITSSISSVNAKDLKDLAVSGVDQALQGKVSGVTINSNGGQPGGGVSVQIRGITSVNSNEPLYVVDGVPILTSTNSFNFSGLGGGAGQSSNSVLSTLNPNDIQSVDILKDASAQAIYGSLGANGVIIITTKHGKSGLGKINYDVYYGSQEISKKMNMMNLSQFATYQNGIMAETGQTPTPEFKDPSALGEGTNWQDAVFQRGHIQNHQLSFSGGQNKTTYYFSGNYFDQTGVLLNSTFKRYSLHANIDQQVKDWFKAGTSINASKSDQRLTLADEQDGTITQALLMTPVVSIRNLDGTYGGQSNFGGIQYYQQINPVAQANSRMNTSTQTKLFGNIYGDIKFTSYLSFHTEMDFDFQVTNNKAFQSQYSAGATSFPSDLIQQTNNSLFWAFKNYLNFNKNFGIHNISATAGHENWLSHYEFIQGESNQLFTNQQVALNNGTGQPVQGAPYESAMESYFARAGYTYNDRYSLSVSFRADASSNFGANNKWGYFPAGSMGWTVTKEKFAQDWKALNYLKLRVGAGATGNQNLPNGAPNPPYSAGISTGLNGFGNGTGIKNIANPDLKWESVVTYNAGIDASFLKGKIDISVDVYNKQTKGMLLFSSVPALVGLVSTQPPIVNAGQMTNKGIDIGITSRNISTKDLTWKTNFIFSHYNNNLDNLISKTAYLDGKVQYNTIVITHTTPGHPVGSFYGGVNNGLFTLKDATTGSIPVQFGLQPATSANTAGTWAGDIKFRDLNGDGKIDNNDVTFIGSPHPKFTYGLTNTLQYRDFDFSVFLQGSYGAKIYNYLRRQLDGVENLYNNQLTDVFERYTPTNTAGTLPRFTSQNKNNTSVSDLFVENGSYLRIQNVSIGYNVPKKYAQKALMTNLRAYFSIQNLYTFTKYTGYDPEIGAFNKDIKLMNVDNGHYPNPRSFTLGLNVEF